MDSVRQYVPDSVAENLAVYLEQFKGLPLYAKLSAGALVLGLLAWLESRRGKKRKLPPGPRGLPFLGAVHKLSDKFHEDLQRLRASYGDVYSFKLSTSLWVVVSGYPAIKEAFVKNAEDFAGRPTFDFDELFPFSDQIFMADYNEQWKKNKKFAVVSLRNFGFGSPRLEDKVLEEISLTIDKMKKEQGKGFNMLPITSFSMARVIFSITIYGDREPTDAETEEACQLIHNFMMQGTESSWGAAAMFLPLWMVKILFRGFIEKYGKQYELLSTFMQKRIEAHKATLDPDNPRDVLDLYISKRLDKDMTMKQLVDTIFIFIPDAVETLSMVLATSMLYITSHPEVQVKIQEEMDRIVGPNKPIRMEHKEQLPYLQAALLETDRISDLVPFAALHKAIADTTFMGYDIPKETVMVPNLHSIHFDEDIFPNSKNFDPCHFLDERGQVKNAEYCVPFSVGRRMCIGEALAKMERFLFAANLYKEFNFCFPPEQPNPPLDDKKPVAGIFFMPRPYKICANPRN